jgi:hypothetical protein
MEITMQDKGGVAANHIPQPRNFQINLHEGYKKITRTWYSITIIAPLLIIVSVVNGVWISNDFLEILTSDKPLLIKAFAFLFIVIGLALVYYTIATFFNRTDIFVNRDVIEIRHQPIPWFGNKKVDVNNIKHLYVKTTYSGSGNYKRNLRFHILAHTNEGDPLKVMTGFQTRNQALYIEQEIENYLGFEYAEEKESLAV